MTVRKLMVVHYFVVSELDVKLCLLARSLAYLTAVFTIEMECLSTGSH